MKPCPKCQQVPVTVSLSVACVDNLVLDKYHCPSCGYIVGVAFAGVSPYFAWDYLVELYPSSISMKAAFNEAPTEDVMQLHDRLVHDRLDEQKKVNEELNTRFQYHRRELEKLYKQLDESVSRRFDGLWKVIEKLQRHTHGKCEL
jgi:hypothetical protein